MKYCSCCDRNLNESDFNSKGNGKLQPYCKDCNKTKSKEYYKANRTKHKKAVKQRKLLMRAFNRRFMLKFLYKKKCKDCPERRIVCLEFDHIKGHKLGNISHLVNLGYPIKTLKTEIRKCELVCANCHRVRTAIRKPTYKALIA